MANLQFYFLGPLEIHRGERQLCKPPALKSQSLLAYLVLHQQRPCPRDQLATLFWGDSPDPRARHSLATALWHIRRCLPYPEPLRSSGGLVQLDPNLAFWLDVAEFESRAASAHRADLEIAVTLYRGELLEGFYDDWLLAERCRLETRFMNALARLMRLYETEDACEAALTTARRMLRHDPLREDAHRVIMRAACRLGQRNVALAQYQLCREVVQSELAAAPMAETTQLYQAILQGIVAARGSTLSSAELAGPAGHTPPDAVRAPLVGREPELQALVQGWQRARAAQGRLILIGGEIGVGKTRLVKEFAKRLELQGECVLWGHCYEFERSLPYQPFAAALQGALRYLSASDIEALPPWVLRAVAQLVPEYLELTTTGPGRTALDVALSGAEWTVPADVDPQQARLFEAIRRLLATFSAGTPLLLILEDLHWAGASTLQLLHYLVHTLARCQVLIVGTFRPEAIGPPHPLLALRRRLARAGQAQLLELSRLAPDAVLALVQAMSPDGAAIVSLAERLYEKSEGNPFFLLAIINALFETGVLKCEHGTWQGQFEQISIVSLPAGAREAIQARVQRLDENAQEALRVSAVLGHAFSFEHLRIVWDNGDAQALRALEQLLQHQLVAELAGHDGDFAFTHHMIQEVIYQSLPSPHRLHWHVRAGMALEKLAGAGRHVGVGELAHHFQEACSLDATLRPKAVDYLRQAAEEAMQQAANEDAIAYYRRALEIIQDSQQSAEKLQQEVELELALAVPTAAVYGYAAAETRTVYDRAHQLCDQLDATPALFTSLVGLARHYGVSGNLKTAQELTGQMQRIAAKTGDPVLLLESYRETAGSLFSRGQLQGSREYWTRGVAVYDQVGHERYPSCFGHSAVVACHGYLSVTLWLLGYPKRARAESEKLAHLLQTLTHPSSVAYAGWQLALHACLRHEAQACLDHAEVALAVSREHGLTSWMALASALRGWALIEHGAVEEGWSGLKGGTNAFRAKGYRHLVPFLLSLQAEACLQRQWLVEANAAVSAARAFIETGVDHYWMAEVTRLTGELLLAQGEDRNVVARQFWKGLEVARSQDARMLELRAALSLVRLDRGTQAQQAWEALANVYNAFDEGFASPELQQAAALLAPGPSRDEMQASTGSCIATGTSRASNAI